MIIHKTQQITKMRLKTAGVIGQQAILRLHEMKSMFYCSLSDLATTLRMFLLLRVFLSVYTCKKLLHLSSKNKKCSFISIMQLYIFVTYRCCLSSYSKIYRRPRCQGDSERQCGAVGNASASLSVSRKLKPHQRLPLFR